MRFLFLAKRFQQIVMSKTLIKMNKNSVFLLGFIRWKYMPLATWFIAFIIWVKITIGASVAEEPTKTKTETDVLKEKIEVISTQQQNFITGAVGFFGIISAVSLIREFALNNKEKQNLKEEITKDLVIQLNKIAEKELIEIQRNLKWLDYQIAILAAEHLRYDFMLNTQLSGLEQCNSVYLVALYEHIRAIRILGELKQIESLDSITESKFNYLFDVVYSAIKEDMENSTKIKTEVEKMEIELQKTLLSITNLEEIVVSIPDKNYQNEIHQLLTELGIN